MITYTPKPSAAEARKIKARIAALTRRAENGEDFAQISFLETTLAGGPWFNAETR